MSEPVVTQQTPQPTGSFHVSRQLMLRVTVGFIVLAIIMYFGSTPKKPYEKKPVATEVGLPAAKSVKGDKQDLQAELAAAQREANEKQKQLEADLESLNAKRRTGGIPGESFEHNGQVYSPREQRIDPIEADRAKHMYTSLYASPVVFVEKKGPPTPMVTSSITPGAEVTKAYPEAKQDTTTVAPTKPVFRQAPSKDTTADPYRKAEHPKDGREVLYAGTIIESALVNSLDGEFSGPVKCMISTNVYAGYPSPVVVIPRGSVVMGEAKQVQHQDQSRLAVTFSTVTMPDGSSLDLDELGLDQGGETALKDKINHHYLSTFATSAAIGLLGGLSLAGTTGGYVMDGGDAYRQAVARQMGSDARQILASKLNRMPTITIRPGHRVVVMLTKQIRVPPYGEKQ